jgi:hypothetical protein
MTMDSDIGWLYSKFVGGWLIVWQTYDQIWSIVRWTYNNKGFEYWLIILKVHIWLVDHTQNSSMVGRSYNELRTYICWSYNEPMTNIGW